jgi:hypothetical protein
MMRWHTSVLGKRVASLHSQAGWFSLSGTGDRSVGTGDEVPLAIPAVPFGLTLCG